VSVFPLDVIERLMEEFEAKVPVVSPAQQRRFLSLQHVSCSKAAMVRT